VIKKSLDEIINDRTFYTEKDPTSTSRACLRHNGLPKIFNWARWCALSWTNRQEKILGQSHRRLRQATICRPVIMLLGYDCWHKTVQNTMS